MHSVTSNAVYNKIFPDYNSLINIQSGVTTWNTPDDCYIVFVYVSTANNGLLINGNMVSSADYDGSFYSISFSGYVKKGQTISTAFGVDLSRTQVFKAYKV